MNVASVTLPIRIGAVVIWIRVSGALALREERVRWSVWNILLGVVAWAIALVRTCVALSEQIDVAAGDRNARARAHERYAEAINVRDVETRTIALRG